MRTKLDYQRGDKIIPEHATGISPSQLHKFFDKPHEWYREQILGETGFTGSTASYLGTVVHFIAEEFAKNGSVDKTEIYKYLSKELNHHHNSKLEFDNHNEMENILRNAQVKEEKMGIELNEILDQYKIMGNELIEFLKTKNPQRSEEIVAHPVNKDYYICGSCDAVYNERQIIDYKTTSDLNPKNYIPYHYKLQLLAYAWIYKQQGLPIDTISIVWITKNVTGRISEKTGKPMKDYPSQVMEVKQTITQEDWNFIESVLNLIADTVDYVKKNPETAYIVFKDYRLKENKGKVDYNNIFEG